MGCCLHYLLEKKLGELSGNQLTEDELREMLTFANAAASIITTRKGALKVMPSRDEIRAMMSR